MNNTQKYVQDRLFELQDLKYRDFNSKLIPTVEPDLIIAVRTPVLRKFAKEFSKDSRCDGFLKSLPHKYYEENNLHAFLIEQINDYDLCIAELERFLPYVDNWATCDMMRPKVFKKNTDHLLQKIKSWIKSDKTYTIRFAIGLLMRHFLDDHFDLKYADEVAGITSEEYYIKMMIAWYFATALAKQYELVLPYLEDKRLDDWVHNKAIQKSIESHRITDEQKAYLRTLKVRQSKLH